MPKQSMQPSNRANHEMQWDTPLQNLYLELEARVQEEIKNIKGNDFYTQYKIFMLRERLHTLLCVIIMKENLDDYIDLANNPSCGDIDLIELSTKNLTTLDDLIDYKIRVFDGDFVEKCSLREILNMARGYFSRLFSSLFLSDEKDTYYGLHPALWGKTNSLSHFEKAIEKEPLFDVTLYKHNRNNFFKENIVARHKLEERDTRRYDTPAPWQKNGPG